MKVVCIDNGYDTDILIIGEIYETLYSGIHNGIHGEVCYYEIDTKDGLIYPDCDLFITLAEYREKQINEILS